MSSMRSSLLTHFSSPAWCDWRSCLCRPDYLSALLPILSNPEITVRQSGGRAIAGGMYQYSSGADAVVSGLFALFDKHSTPLALSQPSSWITRHGVVSALGAAAVRHVSSRCSQPSAQSTCFMSACDGFALACFSPCRVFLEARYSRWCSS